MERDAALRLLEELRAVYIADDWPKRRGAKIAKKTALKEPVVIDRRTIPTGTEVVFHPPQHKMKPYSAVIFYETERYTTIMSDGTVTRQTVAGRGRAVPRPTNYHSK